jgi:enamine deaminase RidA (YjgF/YER057c/UK114 family)
MERRTSLGIVAAALCAVVGLPSAAAQSKPAPTKPASQPKPAAGQAQPAAQPKAKSGDKYSWCSVRKPGQSSPSIEYSFPARLAQVDTYSVSAAVPADATIVYFAGQIPIDDQYAVQGKTLTEQLFIALRNLCVAMEDRGVTTADVFKITVTYVHKDAADPFVLAEEVRDFFEREQPPVTTMLATTMLITDQIRVQVEATALLPKKRGRKAGGRAARR